MKNNNINVFINKINYFIIFVWMKLEKEANSNFLNE